MEVMEVGCLCIYIVQTFHRHIDLIHTSWSTCIKGSKKAGEGYQPYYKPEIMPYLSMDPGEMALTSPSKHTKHHPQPPGPKGSWNWLKTPSFVANLTSSLTQFHCE